MRASAQRGAVCVSSLARSDTKRKRAWPGACEHFDAKTVREARRGGSKTARPIRIVCTCLLNEAKPCHADFLDRRERRRRARLASGSLCLPRHPAANLDDRHLCTGALAEHGEMAMRGAHHESGAVQTEAVRCRQVRASEDGIFCSLPYERCGAVSKRNKKASCVTETCCTRRLTPALLLDSADFARTAMETAGPKFTAPGETVRLVCTHACTPRAAPEKPVQRGEVWNWLDYVASCDGKECDAGCAVVAERSTPPARLRLCKTFEQCSNNHWIDFCPSVENGQHENSGSWQQHVASLPGLPGNDGAAPLIHFAPCMNALVFLLTVKQTRTHLPHRLT